jgi:uncharacterized glyoxalase superfamily protein PhnB
MFFNTTPCPSVLNQIPLVTVVNEDDQLLKNSPVADWYDILINFDHTLYKDVAADYYNALFEFNQKSTQNTQTDDSQPETKDEATQRLLFSRPTINKEKPVLYEPEFKPLPNILITADDIIIGIPPHRCAGRRPKCFFGLFKSFLGAVIMGFPPEPEIVHMLLTSNLSFARACGYIPIDHSKDGGQYWYNNIPSLRKLEQFDQIMKDYGIWDKIKWNEVRKNIKDGVIEKEPIIVGDTTHYHACSSFHTVIGVDENNKEIKKSQSITTKNCQCDDKNACSHPWELADDGAGTIVKSGKKQIWGHKGAVVGLPDQGIPLDVVAVSDAATHDGETLHPHLTRLFDNLPEVKPWIETVLYDSACDNRKLKDEIKDEFDINLRASLNPRRRKTIEDNLPKGMDRLTPRGNLTCNGGVIMDFVGVRSEGEKYIYEAPKDEAGNSVCLNCKHKPVCSPLSEHGRVVTIPFNFLPHIDSNDPPMAKRFKEMMSKRPSVERIIKRLKIDFGDDRLKKRGNDSFQAYLDKTMIGLHIVLRHSKN